MSMKEQFEVEREVYNSIAKEIHSDTSPVGIDAKKTHILILYKLEELAKRLEQIEAKMDKLGKVDN